MLIDFSFSNFRSFRDEQAFSMSRSAKNNSTSTVTAVYGSNASGKSNFLKALATMTNMVRNSYSQGVNSSGIIRDAFALTDNAAGIDMKPSEFLAEFIASDRQKYRYYFTFDSERIIEESLTVYRRLGDRLSTRPALLFAREDGQKPVFGPRFGAKGLLEETLKRRANALILSAAAAAGVESTQPAFDFLARDIVYCEALAFPQEKPRIAQEFSKQTRFSKNLAKLLHYADFGIGTMDVVPASLGLNDQVIAQLKRQLHDQLGADDEKLDAMFAQSAQQSQQQVQFRFQHTGEHGVPKQFNEAQESQGTLGALSFFSLALRQLSHQTVTLIDEIDTSLHPLLVRQLVSLFADPETNPHGSQLIFTTHDISLLSAGSFSGDRLLEPDQIWFVEKDIDGASEIYPVTDMKLRKGENISKNYMNGVYGAVPTPGFHSVFAQIINEQESDDDSFDVGDGQTNSQRLEAGDGQ
ncbi:ATP-binding protein [Bifidobacterium sp. ESL0732]|uniref:AAA family ATPase n=1 Tax=Bifidobacterium sp. ESL0732 TaxID=2983222 RepID=UPI0023F86A19|nr:ATP-binding protein [Bifidobacterium sp. ESL0732]WEV64529.1 ATP-binding protein [Bifidobacterium sp. ESL0732]